MEWPLHAIAPTAAPPLAKGDRSQDEVSGDSWVLSAGNGALSPFANRYRPTHDVSWGDLTPAPFPTPGETFLGFRLVAELGRGAFGCVYLARQDDLAQRLVALKVSSDRTSSNEAQNLAQLQHTHIVPIYSIHRAGPLHAVCMPFFGSSTLADVLAELSQQSPRPSGPAGWRTKGIVRTIRDRVSRTKQVLRSSRPTAERTRDTEPLPPVPPSAALTGQSGAPDWPPPAGNEGPALRELEKLTDVDAVLWIGERLADGLAHAHERGILHHDLKPANVLLTDGGQPMLLDFNLSSDTKTEPGRARLGGTLPYMAPEHLACFAGLPAPFPARPGAPAMPDARSDVYSLGVILYELLTGRSPFERPAGNPPDLPQRMMTARLGSPPPVRPYNRNVSPAAESIVRHCLEPDPSRRYQSARELRDDLARQRSNLPLVHAREVSVRERSAKWARRNRRPVVLAAGVLAGLLIFGLSGSLAARVQRLARMDAAAVLAATLSDRDEAFLFLGARPGDPEQRREGLAVASRALARYEVTRDAGWQEKPPVRNLPPPDRQRLIQAAGELLLLSAGVAGPDAKETLIERAEGCFMKGWAPRALYVHRLELANRKGNRETAKAWRELAERCPVRTATDHYLLARDQADGGNFTGALAHLQEAVRLEPKHFAAWYLRGNCHLDGPASAELNAAEAIPCYTVCIALRPNFHGSHFNRGIAHLRTGQHARAEADFDAALELRPALVEGYVLRGKARAGQNKLREALADYDKAIGFLDAPTRAFFFRAEVRRKLGDADGAALDHQEGLRRPPRDEESFVARGVMLARTDPRAAVADFREAVKLNPRSAAGLYNQALLLASQLGQTAEAVRLLDDLIARHPQFVAPRASRGILLARLGHREAAHRDSREAERLAVAQRQSGGAGQVFYQAACIHALTSRANEGDRTEALRLLSVALSHGFGLDRAEADPDLAGIHDDPRFHQLLDAMRALKAGSARRI